MADVALIQQTLEMLGPNAPGNGWDDTRVGTDLDNGLSQNQIALAWWRARVAMLADMMDVSEAGSSRSLNQSYTNAIGMMNYYQGLVNQDTPIDNPRGTLRSYPIRRL